MNDHKELVMLPKSSDVGFILAFAACALVSLLMAFIPLYQVLLTFYWLNTLQPLSLLAIL